MNKDTLGKILSILLTAVIALLAIYGYDVTIIQPRAETHQVQTRGVTNLDALTLDGALIVTGATTLTSAPKVGSYQLAVSNPLTVTGVITNVRILYYAVP
jgi:hypothetical protein